MSTVAITRDDHVDRAVAGALGHLDLDDLRGRVVAIKANDTWASEDDTTAVTQPDTLRAVVRAMKGLGPRELVVTGGSGAAPTEEVFRAAGLLDVLHDEGVELVDHNRPPFEEVELSYPRGDAEVTGPQASVVVSARVLDYERVVAVNQLKLHETATVTLALKNIAMSYPAADHYGYPRAKEEHGHAFFDDMHSFIAAMAERFPISLAVTVGHPAMIATGPIGGHAVETGIAIASRDALAADVVGAKLLGFGVQAVRHLWEAARMDLGESDLGAMSFPAMGMQDAIGAFTSAAYGRRLSFQHA